MRDFRCSWQCQLGTPRDLMGNNRRFEGTMPPPPPTTPSSSPPPPYPPPTPPSSPPPSSPPPSSPPPPTPPSSPPPSSSSPLSSSSSPSSSFSFLLLLLLLLLLQGTRINTSDYTTRIPKGKGVPPHCISNACDYWCENLNKNSVKGINFSQISLNNEIKNSCLATPELVISQSSSGRIQTFVRNIPNKHRPIHSYIITSPLY